MNKAKLSLVFVASLFLLTACTTYSNQDPETTDQDSTSQTDTTMSENGQTLGESTSKVNAYSEAPEALSAKEMAGKIATISTELGDIKIEFFHEEAPLTVSNFINLTNDKFYDGLTFHRRVEGFVLQGGDPAGDGTGGPGYQVPAEINENLHIRGAVATARLGDAVNPEKKSSGSQFYIVLDDSPFLDGEYTVFGRVVEGMDIVDQLQVGSVMQSVVIE